MKRTVPIADLNSLYQVLNSVQFPCTIEISYTIKKSERYALREDLPEQFGFREFEGAWGFNDRQTFFTPLSVAEIARMALELHSDAKLIIDEPMEDEYVSMVQKRKGYVNTKNGWEPASEEYIRNLYQTIKKRTAEPILA